MDVIQEKAKQIAYTLTKKTSFDPLLILALCSLILQGVAFFLDYPWCHRRSPDEYVAFFQNPGRIRRALIGRRLAFIVRNTSQLSTYKTQEIIDAVLQVASTTSVDEMSIILNRAKTYHENAKLESN